MKNNNLIIEDARIIFRNFAGAEDKFNRAGVRNFALILDDERTINDLVKDGWNVKSLKPRDEEEAPTYYLPVTVNMNGNVRVNMVTKKNIISLDEDSIDTLDFVEIQRVDITVVPYDWEVQGKSGRKAYLKTLYVTIVEDDFEDRYNNRVIDDGEIIESFSYRR